jgi:peptidoglycan/xylan/chitin deacetylase (PgdA/CDA1 family)
MTSLVRDLIGYGKDYPRISWPGGARIAVALVVNYEEGSERSLVYGDDTPRTWEGESFLVEAGRRDLRYESTFDYGARVGVWRFLDMFDKLGVKVTFSVGARALEKNPIAAAEITARGHEPQSHGYLWMPIGSLSREQQKEHIDKAVEAIRRTTGERPLGWRSQGPSEITRELIIEEGGFLYDGDCLNDDLPYFINASGRKWLVIPYSLDTNDMKFWHNPGYSQGQDFLDSLKDTFDFLYEEGKQCPKMMSVGLHPRQSARPSRAGAVSEFIRYAQSFPGVWFARRIDIARWWLENYSDHPALPAPPSGG